MKQEEALLPIILSNEASIKPEKPMTEQQAHAVVLASNRLACSGRPQSTVLFAAIMHIQTHSKG